MKTTIATKQTLQEVQLERRPTVKGLLDEIAKLRDTLQLQEARIETLKKQAMEDVLTGLPNRRAFEEELKKSLSYYERYNRNGALLLIDVDAFKSINDTLGHMAGDELLKHLAKQLQKHTRATDFLARLAGDEFCVLLREVSQEEAIRKVEELATAIALAPLRYDGKDICLSISVGHCMFGGAKCQQELFDKADRAMYAHKNDLTLIDNS